ncbi:helix-turn-helix domain-containing protein [Kibdelosporangium persicum]|uniref:XRE family transcriptional regulator n=1 Tax=Kibdelosporangium persicum TaxID=2698649 RepID=A0ABX2EZZ6_9PSEU|nr:XRE family transcriptional regulator [Kibdelosporangium persicum]
MAGRLGMTRQNLSKYERGERRVLERGLLTRIAEAYECHVLDLTGEPYSPVDEQSAIAHSAIMPIQLALLDCDFDDVPDQPARPLDDLARGVRDANRQRDFTRYEIAGRDLGDLLTELQIVAATGDEAEQRRALTLFVEACLVAYEISKNLGHPTLGVEAARRGLGAAKRLGDPAMLGFARWYYALGLMRVGAHRRAAASLARGIEHMEAVADPSAADTLGTEIYGLLHLTSALEASRTGRADVAHGHLAEAQRTAARTGERNGLMQHFGPTNCAAWSLTVGVELGEGAGAAERARRENVDLNVFDSPNRVGAWHYDFARALAQDGGGRDMDAIRHLDIAARTAPQRLNHDPIARELVMELDGRARMAMWELDSLRNRFGLNVD